MYQCLWRYPAVVRTSSEPTPNSEWQKRSQEINFLSFFWSKVWTETEERKTEMAK
jgi:hypothetical protein